METSNADRDLMIPDETLASMRLPTSRDIAILSACTIEQAEQAADAMGVEPIATLKVYRQEDLQAIVVAARDLWGPDHA